MQLPPTSRNVQGTQLLCWLKDSCLTFANGHTELSKKTSRGCFSVGACRLLATEGKNPANNPFLLSMKGISALQHKTHPNSIIQVLLDVFLHEGLQGVASCPTYINIQYMIPQGKNPDRTV